MNDTDIKLKKQKVLEAQKELEVAEQLKINEKNAIFTNEVNQNVKNFENIKKKIGDLKLNEDISELAKDLQQIKYMLSSCYCHDYDDTPYGGFCIGPAEAHKTNSTLKREIESYTILVNKHIMDLLVKFKWIKS